MSKLQLISDRRIKISYGREANGHQLQIRTSRKYFLHMATMLGVYRLILHNIMSAVWRPESQISSELRNYTMPLITHMINHWQLSK